MKLTLTYFDFAASRGEECRLALHHAGVPFTDERLSREQWLARKPSTPFGALPVLTAEGHGQLAQSNAILVLVGRLHDLHPQDPWAAARHESLMAAVEDLRVKLNPINRIKDPDEKRRAREEIATGYLQEWGASVEKQLGDGPFVAGAKLHVADIKLFVALSPFLKGSIDHVPSDVFKAFPRLLRLFEAVQTHPKTVAWYAKK
jgi:prostaglandin-H2 D-isomerase / glutathione transferase